MKRRMNTVLTLVFSIMLLFPAISEAKVVSKTTAQISNDIIITVNGQRVDFKAAVINGKSYLPVRVLGYAMNSTVHWDTPTRQIKLETQDKLVPYTNFSDLVSIDSGNITALGVDDMKLFLNGVYNQTVSKQIVVIENRSYLPVRSVAENLGIRSTWNQSTKTIEVINPRTVQVADIDRPYYVTELPNIEKQEDYLIGNWKGQDSFTDNYRGIDYRLDSAIYITRNNDGTYNQVTRYTFNDPHNQDKDGQTFVFEYYDCTFDSSTNLLVRSRDKSKLLANDTVYPDLVSADVPLYLDGEVLSANYGSQNGIKASYQRF